MSVSGNVITGVNGKLDVYVSKAKDLPNLRRLDKQDPFVKLRIGHLTEVSPVIYRGGQTPKFDFHCAFQLTPDIKPLLCVELYDDHDHKHGSKLIGKCDVDLTPALLSDPEEGHDRWYHLTRGSLEAGKVYIELTFVPNNISLRRQLDLSDIDNYIQSRPIPPLPSDPSHQTESFGSGSTGYTHASMMKPDLPELVKISNESANIYQLNERAEFTSSINTNNSSNTYQSQQTQSTEGLMDKLKLIKEKLNYFKNGATETSENTNAAAMDLEVLQKVVGAGLQNSISSRVPTNMNDLPDYHSRSITEPPLPPLPSTPSRKHSSSSVRHSLENMSPLRSSGQLQMSPKLPQLPETHSPHSSRHGSGSPARRRPPPL